MEDKTRITYPESEKVYMQGQLHPYLKVGMRKVNLTPTVVVENGKKVMTENAPVYIYDTSGAYSDPNLKVDLKKGLPRLREPWIQERVNSGETGKDKQVLTRERKTDIIYILNLPR